MPSKANLAEILSRVTWAIVPGVHAANYARTGYVQRRNFIECARVRIPFSFIFFLRLLSTWSFDKLARVRTRDAAATPLSPSLLVSIFCASFFRNSNVGIAVSFLPRTRACTAFASTTDKMKVNCLFGHHFVAQTSSDPIGSWRRLFDDGWLARRFVYMYIIYIIYVQ